MKYICLGYYDKGKFDAMPETERNAMFDKCFDFDDHLRANGHWGGGEARPASGADVWQHFRDSPSRGHERSHEGK